MIRGSVLSAAAYLARVPEQRSGRLLVADPGPRSALQSAVLQVRLEGSRPRRHHQGTAITLDILAITDTPDITAILATTVIMAPTNNPQQRLIWAVHASLEGSKAAQEIGTCGFKTKGQQPQEGSLKYSIAWEKEGGQWRLMQDIWNTDK
jgi:hypothetical protein